MLYFCEEVTQILIFLEGLKTHVEDQESCSVSVSSDNERVGKTVSLKESTALITFRWLMSVNTIQMLQSYKPEAVLPIDK